MRLLFLEDYQVLNQDLHPQWSVLNLHPRFLHPRIRSILILFYALHIKNRCSVTFNIKLSHYIHVVSYLTIRHFLTRVYFLSNFMKLSKAELLLWRDMLLALAPWRELIKGTSASSGSGVPSIDSDDCFLSRSFLWISIKIWYIYIYINKTIIS